MAANVDPINPKVIASGVTTAIVTILIWLIGVWFPNLNMPVLVQGAITAVLGFAAGYIKKDTLNN